MSRYHRIDMAYAFLLEKEKTAAPFSIEELAEYVGWTSESCKTYVSKRWFQYLNKRSDNKYDVRGISSLSQNNFRILHSQKLMEVNDVSERSLLIKKAKEFALLGVAVYNNPFTEVKTYGFIVNIVIAFTSLFHAIFHKNSIDFYYKDEQGNYLQIDGEYKAWELSTCCDQYWERTTPEKANLKFLIGLRNKIEHRNLPHIDLMVAGYCQAALSNFETLMVEEFGEHHALLTNLAIAMQLTRVATKQQEIALKIFQKDNYQVIKQFMETFNNDLCNDEILDSQKYRIRAFLIPKIGNHQNSSDLAIEFVNAKNLNADELANYNHAIALIKGVESPFKLRPKKVVDQVKEQIPEFNMSQHTRCWKQFKARPTKINPKFKGKYAAYIEGFDGYLYSQEWVNFLINELTK
ncbi:DUF3644 domain-containing protein [Fluoribacter dumoffii]|uniref:Protein of uncharacterized function (DUF3644) n=1 Tax=Fluoribacter dumoffii TaxID=463 RepID=A0A377G802_9GAMM|nr:DUF3644 domain-containing protein [Fluoribacter dumoffii]KTC89481.1 hypothetical protein Ldum_0549 [Fluoribacter dumoffii NY 23]STO20590.1 Protein of uncharacterised function (DUF3644) [Fluoribacter dumoffii]